MRSAKEWNTLVMGVSNRKQFLKVTIGPVAAFFECTVHPYQNLFRKSFLKSRFSHGLKKKNEMGEAVLSDNGIVGRDQEHRTQKVKSIHISITRQLSVWHFINISIFGLFMQVDGLMLSLCSKGCCYWSRWYQALLSVSWNGSLATEWPWNTRQYSRSKQYI